MEKTAGSGKKLAIYVPKEDEFVISELEKIQAKRAAEGFRTSLSFELVRALKDGLKSSGIDLEKSKKAWLASSVTTK